MATTSIWRVSLPKQVKTTVEYVMQEEKTLIPQTDAIESVISYAMKEEKVTDVKDKYITTINCSEICAYEEMQAVKKQFNKEDGTLLYHGYQSFKENELTAEQCHEIGVRTAKKVWGDKYQVVVTTHTDTDNLHNHFVINTVSFVDGKKYSRTKKDYEYFRQTSDALCKEYNLSVLGENAPTKKVEPNKRNNKKDIARTIISEALKKSNNLSELKKNLSLVGCESNFSLNRKYFTITPYGYERAVRLYQLGEEFTNKAILERLEANVKKKEREIENEVQRTPQNEINNSNKHLLVLRKKHKKKQGGLQGLYLYYCYLLGILPKGVNKKVHPIFLSDLKDFDKIYNELKLLMKNNILTPDEVIDYKTETEKKIDVLSGERKNLYNNASRSRGYKNERFNREIVEIGKEIKQARDDIKSYERILDKTDVYEKKIHDYEDLKSKEEKRR